MGDNFSDTTNTIAVSLRGAAGAARRAVEAQPNAVSATSIRTAPVVRDGTHLAIQRTVSAVTDAYGRQENTALRWQ